MDAVIMNSETVERKVVLIEDVLIEILALLPPKSIFRFMSVSKRWRNIITNPFFLQRYSAVARRRFGGGRLVAFFQRITIFHNNSTISHQCKTLRIPIRGGNIIKDLTTDIVNSSNGLILCSCDTSVLKSLGAISPDAPTRHRQLIYHVVNPVTGKMVLLPPPPHCLWHSEDYLNSVGIMCEETTTELFANYIVVRACYKKYCRVLDNNIQHIQTYSSRTGEWTESFLETTGNFSMEGHCTRVANGVFHWYTLNLDIWNIAVYDPNDGQNHLQVIQLPRFDLGTGWYVITRFVADDLLWVVGLTNSGRVQMFKLPKGEDGSYRRKSTICREEWVLVYNFVDLQIGRMRLMALVPWDFLVAVVSKGKELYLYNFERKTIERIECDDTYYEEHCSYLVPYLEPPFLSSYAL